MRTGSCKASRQIPAHLGVFSFFSYLDITKVVVLIPSYFLLGCEKGNCIYLLFDHDAFSVNVA